MVLMENQGKKIFVVDDDISIGEIVCMLLELEGYEVNSFSAGKIGVERAKFDKPDLVLLDYFLPGERAEEIIENMRKAAGDKLPIVLMSANTDAGKLAEKLSVNEFIAKPFQRERLLEAIERNLN
ncbi:MAG TPA: response regulator [Candidatus Limnocylindrales bacterium]|nr:response regulator [Candidatus Limnocylindrales bacterium]